MDTVTYVVDRQSERDLGLFRFVGDDKIPTDVDRDKLLPIDIIRVENAQSSDVVRAKRTNELGCSVEWTQLPLMLR